MRGAIKPNGSYAEHRMDRIPLLVSGRSWITILNWKVSDSAHHMMPRVRSIGKGSHARSNSCSPFARSSGATAWMTSFLWLLNLCNLRPAFTHASCVSNEVDGSLNAWYWLQSIVYIEVFTQNVCGVRAKLRLSVILFLSFMIIMYLLIDSHALCYTQIISYLQSSPKVLETPLQCWDVIAEVFQGLLARIVGTI